MDRAQARSFMKWVRSGAAPEEEFEASAAKSPTSWEQSGDIAVLSSSGPICTLDGLLEAADVDSSLWMVTKWVCNKWDGMGKNGPIPMWQVKAWLERVPEWANLEVKPVHHLKRAAAVVGAPSGESEVVLVIPDSQNGYRRTADGSLDPMHDRRAWDLSIQMADRLRPATIVLLGDMLDLAPWGSFAKPAEVKHTTQPSLVELHWWLGQLRLASPSSRILYIEGNHEFRIQRSIVDSLGEAEGIRPADDPGGHDALSVPRLLALDSLDIEYIGPYGEGFWLWDDVFFHHGTVARKGGGSTVASMLKDATYSTIVGHIHRLELGCKVIHGPGGQRTITCMSPGTLCRTDGAVPAATPRVDWQQGLGVVTRGPGQTWFEVAQIHDGRLVYGSLRLEGRDRIDDLSLATGVRF